MYLMQTNEIKLEFYQNFLVPLRTYNLIGIFDE
jgi:hypothetical protein